jgi:hypothetical protein
LFALRGEARGAARLSHEGSSGALVVELVPREGGEYEAWLVRNAGAVLRAPLGPAMTASLPADAKDASGVFVSRAGKIVASGFSGLTRAEMEAAALRVQLALAQGSGNKPAAVPVRPVEPVRVREPEAASPKPAGTPQPQAQSYAPPQARRENIVPASRASQMPFSSPAGTNRAAGREERAERLMREALRMPEVKSEAALSIVSAANRLFTPSGRDNAENAYIEKGANGQKPAPNAPGYGVRRSVKNARAPMPPAGRHGIYPSVTRSRRQPRGRPGGPR